VPQLWPSFEILQQQLTRWQDDHTGLFTLEALGESTEGRPLYAAILTDPEADPDSKEHVLITAQHSGIERSGAGSVFAIMEWLLSGDPRARETLRRQVIVCMPLVNPDGYVHGKHCTMHSDGPDTYWTRDPYTYWDLDGPKDPESMPESVAVQTMMDRYQPEVHADVHGLDETFDGYMTLENSGFSYSNCALRPYHYEIVRRMDAAALEGGFPSERLEQDGERLLWGPELDEISHKLWLGRPHAYAATYCYNHYHSLILASECMWELSGLLRHQALLQVGNEVWPGEYYPGYATRVIMPSILHRVVAYGQTAAQRRASRVELWNKQGQISHGVVNPQKDGQAVYLCATSREAREQWLSDTGLKDIKACLEHNPAIDAAPIARLLDDLPSGEGQWGAEPNVFLTGGERMPERTATIKNGIAFRLRIPYSRARDLDVRLNGRPLPHSETDGYLTWSALGYIHVQINVPPERARHESLFVVSISYDPGEKRVQGWRPKV